MLQSKTSRWAALTALACVGLLVGAWFLLVSPRLGEAADVQAQTETATQQNQALELKIAQLRAKFATLAEDKRALAKIYEQLPAGEDGATLLRKLDSMATATGVNLKSVTPGAATYLASDTGGGVGVAAAAAAGTGASSGTSAGTADTSAAAGTTGSGAAGSAGTTGGSAPASSLKVVSIPVTLIVSGDYFATVKFLQQLQTEMPRAFLVTTLALAGQGGNGSSAAGVVDLTISGKIFALRDQATGGPAAGAAGTSGTNGTTGTTETTGTTGTNGSTGTSGTKSSNGTTTTTLSRSGVGRGTGPVQED